MIYRIFSGLN